MKLTVTQVTGYPDVDTLRKIRNSCREYMTGTTEWIDPQSQKVWWDNLDHLIVRCFLLRKDEVPIGYGLLRREEMDGDGSREWLTGGLLYEARGQGLGEYLFRWLIKNSTTWPYLEVLRTNTRAIDLYQRLGFRDRRDGATHIMTMRLPSERWDEIRGEA